jgi:hypothetical protein
MKHLSIFVVLTITLVNYSTALADASSCEVVLSSFNNLYNETHAEVDIVNANNYYRDIIEQGNNSGSLISHVNSYKAAWVGGTVFSAQGHIFKSSRKASEIRYESTDRSINRFIWKDDGRYITYVRINALQTRSIDVASILWGDTKPTQQDFGVYVQILGYDKNKQQYYNDSSGYLHFFCTNNQQI